MERTSRLAAAAFVVVGGLVHLQLWRAGYRGIPAIGPLFVVNAAVSAIVAAAVLVRGDVRVQLAGVAFAAVSLGALVASRTVGLFGFTERAWTDQAVTATTAEIGAIVALAAAMVARQGAALTLAPVRTGRRNGEMPRAR